LPADEQDGIARSKGKRRTSRFAAVSAATTGAEIALQADGDAASAIAASVARSARVILRLAHLKLGSPFLLQLEQTPATIGAVVGMPTSHPPLLAASG